MTNEENFIDNNSTELATNDLRKSIENLTPPYIASSLAGGAKVNHEMFHKYEKKFQDSLGELAKDIVQEKFKKGGGGYYVFRGLVDELLEEYEKVKGTSKTNHSI